MREAKALMIRWEVLECMKLKDYTWEVLKFIRRGDDFSREEAHTKR